MLDFQFTRVIHEQHVVVGDPDQRNVENVDPIGLNESPEGRQRAMLFLTVQIFPAYAEIFRRCIRFQFRQDGLRIRGGRQAQFKAF